MRHFIVAIFLLLFASSNCFAQNKFGQIIGKVQDSIENYGLPAATVAVYKKQDSSLVTFRIADNLGEFLLGNIPVNIDMYVVFSYMGYQSKKKSFSISDGNLKKDFREVNLEKSTIQLKDVEIVIPPVQMNGDTIEFNADAFKLEKSATVDDMLRKFPGVVIWADGSITLNSKPVKSVKVNGKKFFGEDAAIATENLPKNIVDRVQAYNIQDKNNLLDTTFEMNIKLKKKIKYGMFGRVAGGLGISSRYASDANLNFFNDHVQVGAAFSNNNINKTADNFNVLLKNASFKKGENANFVSSFLMPGANRQAAGGIVFMYDFLKNPRPNNLHFLSVTYYLSSDSNSLHTTNNTLLNSVTNVSSSQILSILKNNQDVNSITNRARKTLEINYKFADYKTNFNIAPILQSDQSTITNSIFGTSYTDQGNQQSINTVKNNIFNNHHKVGLSASYTRNLIPKANGFSGPVNLDVSFYRDRSTLQKESISEFNAILVPSASYKNQRRYLNNKNTTGGTLNVESPSINALLGIFPKEAITVTNQLEIEKTYRDEQVEDYNNANQVYYANNLLTSNSNLIKLDETPGVKFRGAYDLGSLPGRFRSLLSVNVALKNQFSLQRNTSTQKIQNIDRDYSYFLPSFEIVYSKAKYGRSNVSLSIGYMPSIEIPIIEQIAPLPDSIYVYDVHLANENLSASKKHTISLQYNIQRADSKGWPLTFMMNYSKVENYITSAYQYDLLGRSTSKFVNVDGFKEINLSFETRKSQKFLNKSIGQLMLQTSYNYSFIPSQINNIMDVSRYNRYMVSASSTLGLQERTTFSLVERLNYQKSKSNSQFNYSALSNSVEGKISRSISKTILLNTSFNWMATTSKNQQALNYCIWNFSISKRFFEQRNLEFKLEGFDLLNQNQRVNIITSANTISRINQNTLSRYFLVTLAYYPRKFGGK